MGRAEDLFNKSKERVESAIDLFIDAQQSEELFLYFKCSANNGVIIKSNQMTGRIFQWQFLTLATM